MSIITSERFFYFLLILCLSIAAIVVPLTLIKNSEFGITFIFLGPNVSTEPKTNMISSKGQHLENEALMEKSEKNPMENTVHPNDFENRNGTHSEDESLYTASDVDNIKNTYTSDDKKNKTDGIVAARAFSLEEGEIFEMNATDYMEDYLNDDQLNKYFDDIVAANPGVLHAETTGESLQKRPIHLIEMRKGRYYKPIILIVSGIFGGDWRSTLLSIFIMNYLLQMGNGTLTFLDEMNIYFIPLLNPDAYNHSRSAEAINRRYLTNAAGVNIVTDFNNINKQPETQFFIDNFEREKDLLRFIILFMSPIDVDFLEFKRICFGILLREKEPETYSYFKKEVIKAHFQVCEDKDLLHVSNWAVQKSSGKPVIVFNVQLNFQPDIVVDNLQFLQTNAEIIYNLIMELEMFVRNGKGDRDMEQDTGVS